jgi:hypothetical protein
MLLPVFRRLGVVLRDRLTLAIRKTKDLPSLCAVGGSECWPPRLGSATRQMRIRDGRMESLFGNLESSEAAKTQKREEIAKYTKMD